LLPAFFTTLGSATVSTTGSVATVQTYAIGDGFSYLLTGLLPNENISVVLQTESLQGNYQAIVTDISTGRF
jgi:hypothetical protein